MTEPSVTEHQRNLRILIIDDLQSIHDDIRKVLYGDQDSDLDDIEARLFGNASAASDTQDQFTVDSAYQGEEGMGMVQRAYDAGTPYAMAFVDVRMPPGLDGIATVRSLWDIDSDLQIVICTAYSDYAWDEIIEQLPRPDNFVILKKPFDNIEVLQLAHALTKKWEVTQQARAKMADQERMVEIRTLELQKANESLKTEIVERTLVEEQLRQAQKMEAVGQLAAGIAHDFNNLLTVIGGHVSMQLALPNHDEKLVKSLHQVAEAANRAATLTRQLLAFSRKQRIQPKNINLNTSIRHLAIMLNRIIGEHIECHYHYAKELPRAHADVLCMEQIIINLAVNARDAMENGGTLVISTDAVKIDEAHCRSNKDARPGSFVRLSVIDSGCGMDEDVLARMYEPFFTTKEEGKGTGMGLAMVYGLVKQHDGWIEVSSRVGHGTRFDIYLPQAPQSANAEIGEAESYELASKGQATVLVVEDDLAVLHFTQNVLEHVGYRILVAVDGVEAGIVWEHNKDIIDLLFTDVLMPNGVTGVELARRLTAEKPELKVIYTTGYSIDMLQVKDMGTEEQTLLQKPYSPEELLKTISETMQ